MMDTLIRWRTWIFNTSVTLALSLGEFLIAVDSGFNWREVLPPDYVPYAIVAFGLVNIWMRPRPAVRAKDVAE